jgi:hypothetical protein
MDLGVVQTVTASEANSQEEYDRLMTLAKDIVQSGAWKPGESRILLYQVMRPEVPSTGNMIPQIQVEQWQSKKPTTPPEA